MSSRTLRITITEITDKKISYLLYDASNNTEEHYRRPKDCKFDDRRIEVGKSYEIDTISKTKSYQSKEGWKKREVYYFTNSVYKLADKAAKAIPKAKVEQKKPKEESHGGLFQW